MKYVWIIRYEKLSANGEYWVNVIKISEDRDYTNKLYNQLVTSKYSRNVVKKRYIELI